MDERNRITAFFPYPHDPERYLPNLVNAALYVVEKAPLEAYQGLSSPLDFGKHLFPKMLSDERKLYGYRSPEYIKDVGTPQRLDQAELDFQSGRLQQRSFDHLVPAVFLDRDGTLNVEKNRISSAVDLELIPGVARAVGRLNQSSYRTVVVTNQPVVARGECSEAEMKETHNKLEMLLGREGAYVDAIYYCPHHPDRGFPGEREALKVVCACRKPAPGLVEQATRELHIDGAHSWLIGDTTVDVMTAQNAGLKSILVRTGHAGQDHRYPVKADFEFLDLDESVAFILDTFPGMLKQASEVVKVIKPGDRIGVGGLAGSGKSTWASVFRYALQERGLQATVMPLEVWRKSAPERGVSGVVTRYDVEAIRRFLTLTLSTSDVVILDGVIALMIDEMVSRAALKVFVDAEPTRRKDRFLAEYRTRGFTDAEIEVLYEQHQLDEAPYVLDSRRHADIVLQGIGK
jgi:histidinol-phosphate phosphatase family protein